MHSKHIERHVFTSPILWGGILLSILYASFSFISTIRSDLNDPFIPPSSPQANILWLSLYLSSFLIYTVFLHIYSRYQFHQDKDVIYGFIFSFVFCILLLFQEPVGSFDIYCYGFLARLFNTYNANPYFEAFSSFSFDPHFRYDFENWKACPYGPLFSALAIGINLCAGKQFALTIGLLKLTMILFFLGSVFLTYQIVRLKFPEKATFYTLVVAWNPLLIFEVANNGHNDIIILFFILLTLYFLIRNAYTWMFSTLVVSVLIKFVTVLIIPFFIFYVFRKNQPLAFWRKIFLLSVLITLIAFYPFIKNDAISVFKGLFIQLSRTDFWFHFGSFPLFIYGIKNYAHVPLSLSAMQNGLTAIYLILWLNLFLKNRSDDKRLLLIKNIFWVYMLFFIIACFWLMPWYFIWILPLPVIFLYEDGLNLIYVITLSGILSYFLPVGACLIVLLSFYMVFKHIHGRTEMLNQMTADKTN